MIRPPSRRALARLAAAGCALAAAAGCRSAAPPPAMYNPPVKAVAVPEKNNYGQLLLPEGSHILIEGDSLAYGEAPAHGGRRAPPRPGSDVARVRDAWPELLAKRLGRGVGVQVAAYPGDRAGDAVVRWADAPGADLTILVYGSADYLREDARVKPGNFARRLQQLVDRARANGGWVMLLTPPAYPGAKVNAGLEPYRNAVRDFNAQPHVLVLDLADRSRAPGLAWADKRHLSAAGQRALAAMVASVIQIAPRAAPTVEAAPLRPPADSGAVTPH